MLLLLLLLTSVLMAYLYIRLHVTQWFVPAAVKAVCSEYRIHNADIHLKEDCDVDDLVDVIEGSRV